jgi:NAD(P)-dependent dehydrogenase (short-subunit alcohol dehydrogenase family)
LEYAPRGIRINAVCPGTIETPMVADMIAKGELDRPRLPLRPRSPASARARRSRHPCYGSAAPAPALSSELHSRSTVATPPNSTADTGVTGRIGAGGECPKRLTSSV